ISGRSRSSIAITGFAPTAAKRSVRFLPLPLSVPRPAVAVAGCSWSAILASRYGDRIEIKRVVISWLKSEAPYCWPLLIRPQHGAGEFAVIIIKSPLHRPHLAALPCRLRWRAVCAVHSLPPPSIVVRAE